MRRQQFDRVQDFGDGQRARHPGQSDMDRDQRQPQPASGEHHAPTGGSRQFGQQFGMTGKPEARPVEPLLVDRRGDQRRRLARQRHPGAGYDIVVGSLCAIHGGTPRRQRARAELACLRNAERLCAGGELLALLPCDGTRDRLLQPFGRRAHRAQIPDHQQVRPRRFSFP